MSALAGLTLASAAFVGSHFLLSHPLRQPLVGRLGEGPFRGLYSLVAFATLGAMIWSYRAIGDQPSLWGAGPVLVVIGELLMWIAAILLVGSFFGNPALPGGRARADVRGVFAITRHPMMWSFALWAIVHLLILATPKALILDGAIILLALGGAAMQDRKKRLLMGETWHEWTARTAFWPFARGLASPGLPALIGGTVLFLLATWLHPFPVGVWRWFG